MPTPTLLSYPAPSSLVVDLATRAAWQPGGHSPTDTARLFLAAPFDAMRHHYAGAVMAGLAPRSLLASGRLERLLDALECLMLGPLARRR